MEKNVSEGSIYFSPELEIYLKTPEKNWNRESTPVIPNQFQKMQSVSSDRVADGFRFYIERLRGGSISNSSSQSRKS